MKGYSIINYHTGESFESIEISSLISLIPYLEANENASGFYYVLEVDTYQMPDGEILYFNHNAFRKVEIKTASEMKEILINFKREAVI